MKTHQKPIGLSWFIIIFLLIYSFSVKLCLHVAALVGVAQSNEFVNQCEFRQCVQFSTYLF